MFLTVAVLFPYSITFRHSEARNADVLGREVGHALVGTLLAVEVVPPPLVHVIVDAEYPHSGLLATSQARSAANATRVAHLH